MTAPDPRPWPLSRSLVQCLADQLAPGSRPANVRRLAGGLDAAMHAVDLVRSDGERLRIVLRRYPANLSGELAELPSHGWQALCLLEGATVPAPRPLWFDPAGALFGTPALAMTRLPGRAEVQPRDRARWLRGLAGALADLHRLPADGLGRTSLPGPGGLRAEALAKAGRPDVLASAHVDAPALAAALSSAQPPAGRIALVHGDYHPGNTLWRRGRLCGVVDWDFARVDDPAFDIAYCRLDLALLDGLEAAAGVLRAYEAAAGRRVDGLAWWDLAAVTRALPDPARWLPGYHGAGRRDLTAELLRGRLRAFADAALARAASDRTAG
ncbi:MAG TPA: phosphotransferase [Dehalococcoidia bacterium]|nr:phosphotransferase [Dehalococcoidia bacterium]